MRGRTHSLAARRAVFRWAWRMFRREWRQQLLVLLLLLVAVTAAVASTSVMYNMAPPNQGYYGDANARIDLGGSEPDQLAADLATIEQRFGTVDVLGYRQVRLPGSVEYVTLLHQDPTGPYGATMLSLHQGSYPVGPDQAAVTDGVARSLEVAVGDVLALGGTEPDRTVVGIVENPHQLASEFVLLEPQLSRVDTVGALVTADPDELSATPAVLTAPATVSTPSDVPVTTALGMLAVTTIGMLLVCLVAGASFAVIAGRRLRQLGMLAAVGATPRQLRLVTIAGGIVVGVVATTAGAGLGLLAWFAVAPRLEGLAGHRINPLHLPWWAILTCLGLALATATLSAWWPARVQSQVPVLDALSARPPRPRPARHSGVVALVLLGAGIALLQYADRVRPRTAAEAVDGGPFWQLALLLGSLALIVGMLFVSPLMIRLVAAAGTRAPIAIRLALRDLGRHQGRSAAALAAITLGLAVTVFFVITAAAGTPSADRGNLSDRQVVAWIGDRPGQVRDLPPAELDQRSAAVARLAEPLDPVAVVPLMVAVAPDQQGQPRPNAVWVGQPDEAEPIGTEPLFVATPELLAYYQTWPHPVGAGADVFTVHTGEVTLWSAGLAAPPEPVSNLESLDIGEYTSVPRSLITPDALARRGWQAVPAGWLIEAAGPVTGGQAADARELAAAAGLTVEIRRDVQDLLLIGWVMTAAAAVLALGILAMTIGLIRGEAARELRVLAATGASTRMRRALTSTTAGALAISAALLGTVCAYLLAGPANPHVDLTQVPVLRLLIVVVGIPLVASGAGWLLAGKEPPVLARAALE